MSVINNKYMYGRRILSVDPVSKKKTLGPVERHVTDVGINTLYCGTLKSEFEDRSYTLDVREGAQVCPECHQENVRRHYARAGVEVRDEVSV